MFGLCHGLVQNHVFHRAELGGGIAATELWVRTSPHGSRIALFGKSKLQKVNRRLFPR